MTDESNAVLRVLADKHLMPVQDKHLANVVGLVTGETVRGSWWSHSKGRVIFAVLEELGEHPDVLFTKLLQAKVILIHRQLWPSVLAVALSKETWQLQGLSAGARTILDSANGSQSPVVSSGEIVKEIETRLLAHTRQAHTDTGRHAIVVESWTVWARSANVTPLRSVEAAKKEIQDAARAIGASVNALPWRRDKSAAT